MPCSQTLNGIAKDCLANMGGIVEVLLANQGDVTVTIADGVVTAITMASGAAFKSYKFPPETSYLSSPYVIDKTGGILHVNNELYMQFNRMETAKRVEISAMALADLVGIVKDANGKYWIIGHEEDRPLGLSAGDGNTGTARGDANRYVVTLSAITSELPPEVNASVIAGLLDD